MGTSKNKSMPLTAERTRSTTIADTLRSRLELDEALRDLCEDYRLARRTLMRIRKEKPRPTKRVAEYLSLMEDLEGEILDYLLGKPPQEDIE